MAFETVEFGEGLPASRSVARGPEADLLFTFSIVHLQFTNKKDEMLRKKSSSSSESELQVSYG